MVLETTEYTFWRRLNPLSESTGPPIEMTTSHRLEFTLSELDKQKCECPEEGSISLLVTVWLYGPVNSEELGE